MNWPAAIVALAAAAVAALCAAADGALLGAPSVAGASAGGEGTTLPHGDRRDRSHRALSVTRIVMHLVTGVAAVHALGLREEGAAVSLVGAVLIALAIALLTEAAPRAFGEREGQALLERGAPLVRAVEGIASPFAAAGAWLDARMLAALPPAGARDPASSAEPFRAAFRTQTTLPAVKRDILGRYSSLADTEVQDVMVPRVDIIGIERDATWTEVVERVRSQQHSRLPVFDGTLDQVTGILFAKDLLSPVIEGAEPAGGWPSKVRPASFIPEGKSAAAQLRDFKSSHHHLAIVVDEYGGTAGLVTIEDILEEIVGEIRDETDSEEAPIAARGRGWSLSGRVSLDELAQVTGHHFEAEDVSTVGGLVFHRLGRIPREGERVVVDGFAFTVERLGRKGRRVDRVMLEPPAAPPGVDA